jgi:head-tail adaptor
MKAGALRHWLRLEQPVFGKDAFGAPTVTSWTTVATVPASIDSISAREFLGADRELSGVTWRITLRADPAYAPEANWRGVEVDGDRPRTFDFVAALPSHAREQLTFAAASGTSQP